MASADDSELTLIVDDSMMRNTKFNYMDLDNDYKIYKEYIAIGQGIKRLKQEKPENYRKMVCIVSSVPTSPKYSELNQWHNYYRYLYYT